MCFRWMKRLYHCLRRKCSRRNRGYSREISLSHHGFCSGAFTNRHGRASFSCGREGSVTYTRRPSSCPPPPAPAPYSISAGYSCDSEGSVTVTSGDCGVSSGWDVTVGTVPVYGSGVGVGYSSEDLGPAISSAGGGGSVYHGGDLGTAEGAGYGYAAPLSDPLTTGGVTEGSGYYGGGLGYGIGTMPGPELGPAGGGCAQVVQQKCPVVVPTIKGQQKCPVVVPTIKSQQKCPVVVPTIKGQQKCPMVVPTIKGQQKCPMVVPTIKGQQCKQSTQWPPIQKM